MAGESARESARRQREKAERLQRSAELWERGADGEQRTAEVLSQLPPEWTVFHDLHWPGRQFANVDHVVVGPPGVFVVDSKNWSGTVTVKDDVLRQNSYRREQEVASVAEAALAVGQLVPLLRIDLVRAVLCFVGDRQLSGWARDVMVTSTDTVVSMLLSRPAALSPQELTRVCLDLDASLRPARERLAPVPRPATVRTAAKFPKAPSPSGSPRRAKKSSRSSGPSLLSSGVALLAILAFLYVPGVRTAVTDAVTGLIIDTPSSPQIPGPHEKKGPGQKKAAHPKHK